MRSPLAPFAASMRDPDPDGVWCLGQKLWREHGLVVVSPDDVERRRGWGLGQQVRNLGVDLFGERG